MQVDFPQETAEIQEPTQEAAPTAQNPQNPLVLEQEFQNVELEISRVIEALHEDEPMNKFRIEYEKMVKAVRASRQNLQKYSHQEAAFEKELKAFNESSHDAVKSSKHDYMSIETLKSTIANIQENLNASMAREDTCKEQLRTLRTEISALTMTVKQGVGLSSVQEKTLQELHQAKDLAQKELEGELDKIILLRARILEIADKIKQTDEYKMKLEADIFDSKEKNTLKKGDIEGEIRNKERLEKELRDIRAIVAQKSQEIKIKQDTMQRISDEIQAIDLHIKSQRINLERHQKTHENLVTRSLKLKADCGEQIGLSTGLRDENTKLDKEVKMKSQELLKLHSEGKSVNKIRDALIKRNKQLEAQKLEIEGQRKQGKLENELYHGGTEKIRRQIEMYKKEFEDFEREKLIIDANLTKTIAATQTNLQLQLPYKQTKENLDLEISRFQKEIMVNERTLRQILLERDMYIKDAAVLQTQCVEGLQEIKKKELLQMVQADTKLKHQQALYEAVQSDRNLHAKHFVESQAEITEMRRKLKIMNYQINGFKEDINSKLDSLSKEVVENNKLKSDIAIIKEETENLKNQNEIAQAYLKSQLVEELKLNHFVKEAEIERTRQENAWQVLISERDNLCNQLMKQDFELTRVYGKIKSNTTSLITSEKLYSSRYMKLTNIHEEIHHLRREKYSLEEKTSILGELKQKQFRLENEVIFEKTRVKALEQELENKINVHRWRKLEGSNPKAFEMIQLLHALQRKLIERTKADEEKCRIIKENEEMYLQCKTLLGTQVGPEALEQVKEFEHILKDKQMQLRHMGAELSMYQAQSKEYKYTIDMLDQELAELKQAYIQKVTNASSNSSARGSVYSPIDSHGSTPLPPLPRLQEAFKNDPIDDSISPNVDINQGEPVLSEASDSAKSKSGVEKLVTLVETIEEFPPPPSSSNNQERSRPVSAKEVLKSKVSLIEIPVESESKEAVEGVFDQTSTKEMVMENQESTKETVKEDKEIIKNE